MSVSGDSSEGSLCVTDPQPPFEKDTFFGQPDFFTRPIFRKDLKEIFNYLFNLFNISSQQNKVRM